LPETNTLAYFSDEEKSFLRLTPGNVAARTAFLLDPSSAAPGLEKYQDFSSFEHKLDRFI